MGTENEALLFAAVPCYTSLKQGCMYLSTAQMGSWSSITWWWMITWWSLGLEPTCISFSMPTLLWSHGMTGSGSSTNRKKNHLEEGKRGRACELSSMNCLTTGLKRHEDGQSSRGASFQAAGQQIHPGTAAAGLSSGCPLISSDNCTSNEWD